ncbi:MAG: Re/Si-specific NAD(P)(+) transhydrogenase subunit alpha [Planctomycetes bacterium]|nr:Re/Si-specific NAD(P)(+) transhydrogenase subunit alpha [Planctomycetota bacterium]
MRIAIPKEIHPGEKRVAATPQTVLRLRKLGFEVAVQAGAGLNTDLTDSAYQEAGATIVEDVKALWSGSGVILKVRPPETGGSLGIDETELLSPNSLLISFAWPAQNRPLLEKLAARKVTALAMDCVPRITRAQKMDALSAMANIAGYRSVIEAAQHFPRFFTGQMTAAGKIDPAKVLVIGAGVAGLAAIGAARALGAIVRAFDPRAATRDQVKSMGAEYLELHVQEEAEGKGGYAKEMSDSFLKAEMALFAAQAMEVDVIITTALIPGKPAPKLITAGMVESMKPGSVIVDLAAEQGGNCAMTRPGEVVTHKGVTIVGYTDLPSRVASLSSQLYGATVAALLEEVWVDGKITIDESNQVVRGAMVTHDGKITWPPPPLPIPTPVAPPEPGVAANTTKIESAPAHANGAAPASASTMWIWMILAALFCVGIAWIAPPSFLSHFTVFVLACFVGWQVIWNVKPALHTPLMSVTNAISGIILIGGMLQLSGPQAGSSFTAAAILGAIAVLIATINVAGGFLVTQRMLAMFRRNA